MQNDQMLKEVKEMIESSIDEVEGLTGESAVKRLNSLFEGLKSKFQDHVGMQSIILDMVAGDIRKMESSDKDDLFEIWDGWVSKNDLRPVQVPEEMIREASKRIYGSEEAFVYIR